MSARMWSPDVARPNSPRYQIHPVVDGWKVIQLGRNQAIAEFPVREEAIRHAVSLVQAQPFSSLDVFDQLGHPQVRIDYAIVEEGGHET